jgi:hypothetical protein
MSVLPALIRATRVQQALAARGGLDMFYTLPYYTIMDYITFKEYKGAVAELPGIEQRAAYLRDVIKRFEDQHAAATSAPAPSKRTTAAVKVPYNLQAAYGILKNHGGPMRLRDIAAEHDLTTAGTRAQLLTLIDLKLVEQVDRGVYRAL